MTHTEKRTIKEFLRFVPMPEDSEMPAGSITAYGGSSAPSGWLLCDGAIYSTSVYPELASILGDTFGGDGITDFAVPDLRGRVPLGAGSGPGLTARLLAAQGGQEKITNVPEHNHTLRVSSLVGDNDTPVSSYMCVHEGVPENYRTADNANAGANSIQNTGTAGGVDVMSPFTTVNYIIKLTND